MLKKTQHMIFKSKHKKFDINVQLINNNQFTSKVESTKFLGIIIDEYLTWTEHINTVKTKISRAFGVLCKARKVYLYNYIILLFILIQKKKYYVLY